MFNIFDFIDSKDIREYNRNTVFTPIEQAYLIYYSRKTTVEDKLEAWHELLEVYSEDDFKQTHFGEMQLGEKPNKQILADTVAIYETALEMRKGSDTLVFEAAYYGVEFYEWVQRVYFRDYDSALDYLKKEQEYYKDEEEGLQCGAAVAEIRIKNFGKNTWYDTTFHLDDKLRLITITPNRDLFVSGWWSVEHLFVYIPLPYEKGDFVRINTLKGIEYGVLTETPDEEYYDSWRRRLSSEYETLEILGIPLNKFNPEDGEKGDFEGESCNPLELERCHEKELTDTPAKLTFLRERISEKDSAGEKVSAGEVARYCTRMLIRGIINRES